jgi:hypothetical protein
MIWRNLAHSFANCANEWGTLDNVWATRPGARLPSSSSAPCRVQLCIPRLIRQVYYCQKNLKWAAVELSSVHR